ncbi:ectonucleoside triphosphate diphosphohydrolase 4 isoform X1 [Poecile atricapillus]|uniref:ectonucleoside triphosphate diphosphohydrolase 4 isoform X1 n=1 Tax=Poecile atricapillus TaxID=48891 RepID=UPI00273A1B9F|nr:ectonucleoside triphosphate diphosphohydrolase 4 isoform X1 [Poecile atricapillus]XP_058715338.1 ectonucleoside triphosphate diphosphohydrolase 4 isoform X1 [Poecile atricapillus]
MGRISISCPLPGCWRCGLCPAGAPRLLSAPGRRRLLLLGAGAAAGALLLCGLLLLLLLREQPRDGTERRFLARVTDTEATDTGNPNLNYGIVVDCGSSGSRVFVYCWPRHNGNPKDLLDIQQMRDSSRKPVVMKIKPGISEFASSPAEVSDYISPLLSFAAAHVPRSKHKETPLYILCTAGMRILPESQQKAILEDLLTDIPTRFDFLFSDSHAEVISGKQEGVYAWIGINFVLGRFEHTDDEAEAVVEVQIPGSEHRDPIFRKRTVGILDMGGVSTQIAYEVPPSEEVAKGLLAEFNLGCDAHQTEHVYRVYVATFLGFGGNAARRRYEESLFSSSLLGNSPQFPLPDPCLPRDALDELRLHGRTLHLRGSGDFGRCRELLQPLLNRSRDSRGSLNGVFQPPVHFQSSEFYGFSEFYYCTEDVLRMGGDYSAAKFARAAQDYCATSWSVLRERFQRGLYAPHADLHRLKFQCFKSAWMFEVFHRGFSFPESYGRLRTALQVYDKEVQWTLGAILYRTRFLPLRDIQQENFRGIHSRWRSFSFVYNHYLFLACFLVVLLSILLYLLRLRRIHRRRLHSGASPALWIQEGLPAPKIPG